MSGDPSKKLPFDANNSTLLDQFMGPRLSSIQPIPGVDKMQIIGPVLLPLPANCILASLLVIQITRYWCSPVRRHDAWPTKSLVWCAMMFGIGNMVCTWKWSFDAFVLNFGKLHALFRTSHMTPLMVLLQVELFLMHCWYAYKIDIPPLRKKFLASRPFLSLSATGAVAAFVGVGFLLRAESILVSGPKAWGLKTAQVDVWTGAIADLCITSLVLYKLIRSRRGWKDTDLLAARAGLLILESQMVPTVMTLAIAFYTETAKRPDIAIVWAMIGGNTYALSVLYSLTSRTWFRRGNYRDGSDNYYGKEVDVKVDTEIQVNHSISDPDQPKARFAGLRPVFAEQLDPDSVGRRVECADEDRREKGVIAMSRVENISPISPQDGGRKGW